MSVLFNANVYAAARPVVTGLGRRQLPRPNLQSALESLDVPEPAGRHIIRHAQVNIRAGYAAFSSKVFKATKIK